MRTIKKRRCLGPCGKMRISDHAGDRICNKCKAIGLKNNHGKRVSASDVIRHGVTPGSDTT